MIISIQVPIISLSMCKDIEPFRKLSSILKDYKHKYNYSIFFLREKRGRVFIF